MRFSLSLSGIAAIAAVATAVLATPASAAPPPMTWTGCYVGGHVGYGWGREQWNYGYYAGTDFNQDYGSHGTNGALGGGQLGCNYQMNALVLGIEGTFSWTGMSGNHDDPYGSGYHHSTAMNWVGTIAGRFGVAFDRSLIYGKAGVAWDRGDYSMLLAGISYTDTRTRTGVLLGLGWEQALTSNWSVKVEYNHLNFGTSDVWWNYQYANPADPWSYHVGQTIQTLTLGVNYRFGGGPR